MRSRLVPVSHMAQVGQQEEGHRPSPVESAGFNPDERPEAAGG